MHAQSKADAGCSNGAEKMTINKINGATDDVAKHAGAAIQEHFTRVVELSGDASAPITVRSRATTVVAAALVRGHVPSQEALPSILRSATTDPDESLRRGAAVELDRFRANDGAGRVASSLADGLKLASCCSYAEGIKPNSAGTCALDLGRIVRICFRHTSRLQAPLPGVCHSPHRGNYCPKLVAVCAERGHSGDSTIRSSGGGTSRGCCLQCRARETWRSHD